MVKILHLTLSFLTVALCAFSADVTGTWRTELPGRTGNTRPYTFELKQSADGALSGVVAGFRSEGEIRDGKVDDDDICFSAENQYQARSVLMTFQGKVHGNEMKLTVTFADNNEKLEVTAVRDRNAKQTVGITSARKNLRVLRRSEATQAVHRLSLSDSPNMDL